MSLWWVPVLALLVLGALSRSFLPSLLARLGARATQGSAYWVAPITCPSLLGMLLALLFYLSFKDDEAQGFAAVGCVLFAGLTLVRAPRGFAYAAIYLGLLCFVAAYVFGYAHGPLDLQSDRDDAVEAGAQALLAGKNPWHRTSILGLPITTGPSSLLLALPAVAATGAIDVLSFASWALFLALLVLGDLRNENGSFPFLAGFLLLPGVGFAHTMFWALDELYYGAVLVALVWLLMLRARLFLAGALCALIVLSRLSYAFGLFAWWGWWLLAKRPRGRELALLAGGALSSVVAVLVIFRLVAGRGIWKENFLRNLPHEPLVATNAPLAASLTDVLSWFGGGVWVATLVVIALLVPITLAARRQAQPFLLFAIAMAFAHTIAFSPNQCLDYVLVVLIPGMYAVAFGGAAYLHPALAPGSGGYRTSLSISE